MGYRQFMDMLGGLFGLLVLNFTAWLFREAVPESQIAFYWLVVLAMNTGLIVGIYAQVQRRR